MKKITVGIVGFGVVGKAYLRYLSRYGTAFLILKGGKGSDAVIENIFIWDQEKITDKHLLENVSPKVKLYQEGEISLETFSSICDYIFVSAGVAPNKIPEQGAHVVSEVDLFALHNQKPVIAITGSLGKTTITTLIYKFLNAVKAPKYFEKGKKKERHSVVVGGNIGTSMLDLLERRYDAAVLELSSFQLARNTLFAPHIAIINNIYPNHLDWHKTDLHYFASKAAIACHQDKKGTVLINIDLFQDERYAFIMQEYKGNVVLISTRKPTEKSLCAIPFSCFDLFFVERDILYIARYESGRLLEAKSLLNIELFASITYEENLVFVFAALCTLGVNLDECLDITKNDEFKRRLLVDHKHRLECCLTLNDVDFYNDSKATIIEATSAAVSRLEKNNRPIVLILGGLDKGVDRRHFIKKLKLMPRIKQVYYFGNEPTLFEGCKKFATLEQVVDDLFLTIESGDQVLFSPSGSSFDLFDNYQQRGDVFKSLVLNKSASIH